MTNTCKSNGDSKKLETTQSSLYSSVRDGISYAVMLGAGENLLGPFGVFLRATTIEVGLLATLPQFFGAVMQWVGALALDHLRTRRFFVVVSALVQASVWLPILLLPFWFQQGEIVGVVLIILVTIYHGIAGVIAPIWTSLIGDLVPPENRGAFFGQRNRLTGMATFISLVLAGIILHLFERTGHTSIGFLIIFGVALLARFDSARWLTRHEDPPFEVSPDQAFSFRQFLQRSSKSNYAQFVFFFGAINLAVAFSSPYCAIYMLEDLKFSYLEFTIVTSMATVTQFLTFRYWGALGDRFGNKKILNLCGWGIGIVPFLWLVSANIWYLLIIQVLAGFVWAGFSLASSNFVFDAVSSPKRARCIAYRGVIHGTCVLVGSLAGGWLAGHLKTIGFTGPWFWLPASSFPAIFLISGLMRFFAAGFFLSKFKEVREVELIGNREFIYRASHLRPLAGLSLAFVSATAQDQIRSEGHKKMTHIFSIDKTADDR